MGILRRRRHSASPDGKPGRVTELVGVSEKLGRSETRRTGLYEFRTTAGAPVRLHDAYLVRLVHDVGSPGRLLLLFEYDPEWVPPELAGTPCVKFACEDVSIIEWDEDHEAAADHDAPQGQVAFFDWDGADGFYLRTYSLYLAFTTARITVSLAAARA